MGLQAAHRSRRTRGQSAVVCGLWGDAGGRRTHRARRQHRGRQLCEAPRQRNDREQNRRIKEGERPEEFDRQPAVGRQKDSEARWTKKNEEVHYGWKNHVKADAQTKLICAR
ncbi:MAG: hypothetical protein WDN28_25445 [Chthoniobacter sp.]